MRCEYCFMGSQPTKPVHSFLLDMDTAERNMYGPEVQICPYCWVRYGLDKYYSLDEDRD